ncbi:Disease resistance protein [Quillaja saponaria]|uniref:Disease resistance protein n=1 Tax=Quillaja saponaria TaxID=32244 RepID=A0AAD7QBT3_QUISA|nr:Disease resistance protein [Quillaja saponaria]
MEYGTSRSSLFQWTKILKIDNLSSLPNAFTLSMIKGLFRLQMIEIVNCNNVEEIITEARDDGATNGRTMEFESLEAIVLKCLPNLLSFYSGSATLEYPSLEKITLIGCPKMKTFSSTFSIIENETIDNQQSGGKSKRNQKQGEGDVSTTPIINGKRIHNLEEIHITDGFIEEIIHSCDMHNSCVSQSENLDIKFSKLYKLKQLWKENSQPDPIVQASETLDVRECDKLNTLLPSFVSFKNLRKLKVSDCHGLMSLLSDSMIAKGLGLLTFLYVSGCNRMTEIIANGGGEIEDGIVFTSMKMLVLYNMSSLARFCSRNYTIRFPNLEKVVVCECPEMKIFSPGIVITKWFKTLIKYHHLIKFKDFESYCCYMLKRKPIDKYWMDSDNLNTTIELLWEYDFNLVMQRTFYETRENCEDYEEDEDSEVDEDFEVVEDYEDDEDFKDDEESEKRENTQERPEKKTSVDHLEEKVDLPYDQDQSPNSEYDNRETPNVILPKVTREPRSPVTDSIVDETSPEAETTLFQTPTIPHGSGLAVDSTGLVEDDDKAQSSSLIDPPITKPAHASEVIAIRQTSTPAHSSEAISKEEQILTTENLQGKERVFPASEESSKPFGSTLSVEKMHSSPPLATFDSLKFTTTSKKPEPSGKMVHFQGGQCQVDESFLPLLEEACDKMPQLIECQKSHSAPFRHCAFACLGQVLFLLRNIKIKDMVNHRDELELFWQDAKTMKFDLEWLSPVVEQALATTSLVQEVSRIGKLQEEVKMFEEKIDAAKSEIASIEAKLERSGIKNVTGYFI